MGVDRGLLLGHEALFPGTSFSFSLAASQVTIVGHFLCFTPVLSLFPPLTIQPVSCCGGAWFPKPSHGRGTMY